ncbi:hypothetical protein [Streptomyces hainanensis]|uniref:Uncharacterized protein n=1 Tax=Streptomyces hainanensis TaxID=402648 RepID=A0A4R4TX30_9ACTN|nr:hypothetical protein [Streptomyces hainanensis]TDC80192.1 hypothetical protein E1283_00985 [Streptomyces hainanensis]
MPSTIAGIRAALPEGEREAFDQEVCTTDARNLLMVLARWAMHIPTELDAPEEVLVARLKEGDFSSVTFADETDDAWRSAG